MKAAADKDASMGRSDMVGIPLRFTLDSTFERAWRLGNRRAYAGKILYHNEASNLQILRFR